MKHLLTLCFVMLIASSVPAQTKSITAKEASKLTGQTVTVSDTVRGYKVVNDGMTLLDLSARYPNQVLTVVMKGKGFYKPTELLNKLITVHGAVNDYKGKPEIVLTDPEMLRLRKVDTLGSKTN